MGKANKPPEPPQIQDNFSKELINLDLKGQEIILF